MDWNARSPAPLRFAWIALLFLAAHFAVSAIDQGVVSAIIHKVPEWRVGVFLTFTELGDATYYLVPSLVVALLGLAGRYLLNRRQGRAVAGWIAAAGAFVFVSVAFSGVVVNAIKFLVGRGRPILFEPDRFTGFWPLTVRADFHSFPSGHANTVFAFALAVGFLAPPLRLPLLVLAAVAALPRIVTTAHFVSDVAGGAAIAVVTTCWIRNVWAGWGWVFTRDRHDRARLRPPGRLLGLALRRKLRPARTIRRRPEELAGAK